MHHDPAQPPRFRHTAILVVCLSLVVLLSLCVAAIAHHPTTATASTRQGQVPATNPVLGIDLPMGAVLNNLPPGIRDYIRRTWPGLLPEPPATNPELGIDLPAGATRSDLPPGVSDYLRNQTPEPTPRSGFTTHARP
jgi:hypothetical protein